MKLGINLLLFGDRVTRPALDAFARLRDLGFDGVEVPIFEPDAIPVERIRARAAACGLAVTASGALPPGARLYGKAWAALTARRRSRILVAVLLQPAMFHVFPSGRRAAMATRGLLACLFPLAAAAAPGIARGAERGPNVLMIIADDLDPSLGCFGNGAVKTPNIDRLASRGVIFPRAYSSWASCLPSRVSLLSGWFPPSTGTYDFSPGPRDGGLKDVTYLPEHFKNRGYFTGRLDKVFHIGKDDPQSWTVSEEPYKDERGNFKAIWTGIEVKTLGLEGRVLAGGRYEEVSGEKGTYSIMDVTEDDLFDGRTARRAIELLQQQAAAGTPFFLAAGFRRPHLPWLAPKKYFDLYPPDQIPLPPRAADNGREPVAEQTHREMIAHYYAATSYMDHQVGTVLAELEKLKLADNTIVLLFGDNGYCLGERGAHFGKGNLWERSLHVPLIVVGPGIPAGQKRDVPVSLVDIYPTLVELCGLPAPASKLEGQSLKPLLAGDTAGWREGTLSFNSTKPGELAASIRTARFRYTVDGKGNPLEFVDLNADPYERKNLLGDPRFKAEQERFHAQVAAALAKAVPMLKPPPGAKRGGD